MALEIIPLSENIGAEIRGVDLSLPVDAATAAAMEDAWNRYVLLLFRGQNLSDEALKRSADWLGTASDIVMPLDRRGDDDIAVALISNILDEAGKPIGALGDGEMWFHHDNCYTAEPDKGTWLYAVELPSSGGHTLFANGYLAYEALPDRLKQAIAGRRVLRVYDWTIRERPDASNLDGMPHFWQPAVVVHPKTGRKALYVDRLMTVAIEGYEAGTSDALLDELFPYIERADYDHAWRLDDYVLWDNRCSAHARTDFPADQRRLLKRGKIAGEKLTAAVAA